MIDSLKNRIFTIPNTSKTFSSCLNQVTNHRCNAVSRETPSAGGPREKTESSQASKSDDIIQGKSPNQGSSGKTFGTSNFGSSQKKSTHDHANTRFVSGEETSEGENLSNKDPQLTKCRKYTGPAFFLLNTIRDVNSVLMWSNVGYITASGDRDLRTVLWPGQSTTGHTREITPIT